MKRTQYTVKFKAEVVKQIIEKGRPVPKVSIWLGASMGLLDTFAPKRKGSDEKLIEDIKEL